MNEKIQEKIGTEAYSNIWDMDLATLRDFHVCFCLNTYYAMQTVTQQDISEEFIKKHFDLSRNINRIKNGKHTK